MEGSRPLSQNSPDVCQDRFCPLVVRVSPGHGRPAPAAESEDLGRFGMGGMDPRWERTSELGLNVVQRLNIALSLVSKHRSSDYLQYDVGQND